MASRMEYEVSLSVTSCHAQDVGGMILRDVLSL